MNGGYVPPSGGGGASQLPSWTYEPTTIGSGLFVPNSASYENTTSIDFSITMANGGTSALGLLFGFVRANQVKLILTNPSGESLIYTFTSATNNTTYVTMVVSTSPVAGNWAAGKYTLSFSPGDDQTVTMSAVLANSSITPCPDGTVTPVTSETTVSGITTALS